MIFPRCYASLATAAAAFFFLLGSAEAQTNNVGTISNNPSLSDFEDYLNRVGISPSLGRTVFAPNNDAFSAWGASDPDVYTKYTTQAEFFVHLKYTLLWHLVTEGGFSTDEIFNGNRATLENTLWNMTVDQRFKTIDGVPLTAFAEPNITTSEGYLHIMSQVIIPPFMAVNMIEHMLERDISFKFAYTTMANLALYAGLDEKIDAMYENGLTFLVPPNRRFNRAQIDVPSLLTPAMKEYTTDFVLAHLIMDCYYEAGVFAFNEQNDQQQFLVKSELGTHMWITTTADRLRFQSRDLILVDQAARNGIFHVLDLPVFPPFIKDFTEFTAVSTSWDTSDCFRFFRQALISSDQISRMFNSTLTMFCPTREAFAQFNNEDFQRLLEPKDWRRHATEFLLNMFTKPALTIEELVNMAPTTITMLNGETYELKRSADRVRIKNTDEEQGRTEFGDLIALDGYLHIIDSAITPTAVSRSIYDQSNNNPDFSLLVENIDFVQMTDMVDRDLPLTLLAPDNTAFRRITFGTLDGAEIIKRHIISGNHFCDTMANSTSISAVNGETHEIELRGEPGSGLWGKAGGQNLYVGGAYVYNCDIFARNGVLHHIDRVIGQPYDTVSPTITPAPTITARPTQFIAPTAAPQDIPSGFAPIELPPILPGVVPSASTADGPQTPAPQSSAPARAAELWVFSMLVLLQVVATAF